MTRMSVVAYCSNGGENSIFLIDAAGLIRYIHVSLRSTYMPYVLLIRSAIVEMSDLR